MWFIADVAENFKPLIEWQSESESAVLLSYTTLIPVSLLLSINILLSPLLLDIPDNILFNKNV